MERVFVIGGECINELGVKNDLFFYKEATLSIVTISYVMIKIFYEYL
jgi:hypothetical protein